MGVLRLPTQAICFPLYFVGNVLERFMMQTRPAEIHGTAWFQRCQVKPTRKRNRRER